MSEGMSHALDFRKKNSFKLNISVKFSHYDITVHILLMVQLTNLLLISTESQVNRGCNRGCRATSGVQPMGKLLFRQ